VFLRVFSNVTKEYADPRGRRSKATVCGQSLVGTAGSNPAGGMCVCVCVCVLETSMMPRSWRALFSCAKEEVDAM
jgi:hypothetical protein